MEGFQVDAVKTLMIMSLSLLLLIPGAVAEGDSNESVEERPCHVYKFKDGAVPIAIDPDRCLQKKVQQILSWPPSLRI